MITILHDTQHAYSRLRTTTYFVLCETSHIKFHVNCDTDSHFEKSHRFFKGNTEELTPYDAALCKGMSPPLSWAFTSAPCCNKYSATSKLL